MFRPDALRPGDCPQRLVLPRKRPARRRPRPRAVGCLCRLAPVHRCRIKAVGNNVAHSLRAFLAIPPDRRRDFRRAGCTDSRPCRVRTAPGRASNATHRVAVCALNGFGVSAQSEIVPRAQPSSLYTSPLLILAEGRRSGLVREKAVTSAGDVSPGIKLSRTRSPPRPAGRSLNATIYHAQPSSLYTSPLLILAEGRRSGLVRERAVTSAGDVSPVIKLSRTSSLTPCGQKPERHHLSRSALIVIHKSAFDSGRRPRSGLVREKAVTSAGDVSPGIKLSRTRSHHGLRPESKAALYNDER
ncbi:hypothetical protein ALQ36_103355 [Pseudomonas syringae pv. primulae]|uniref:Uncharacterized protein n=1 Tax=Pseudomonas syringae pv. primulae TaxID=251707 RepID=A0A3M3XD34_9PSED|nr:hypothetical protein ALQ36_103355 [Pseudomonas syringae pv. primulae]